MRLFEFFKKDAEINDLFREKSVLMLETEFLKEFCEKGDFSRPIPCLSNIEKINKLCEENKGLKRFLRTIL